MPPQPLNASWQAPVLKNPKYKDVVKNTTGHYETLEITYDALPSTLAGDNEVAQIVVDGPTPN